MGHETVVITQDNVELSSRLGHEKIPILRFSEVCRLSIEANVGATKERVDSLFDCRDAGRGIIRNKDFEILSIIGQDRFEALGYGIRPVIGRN
jgi:hypothetical protein